MTECVTIPEQVCLHHALLELLAGEGREMADHAAPPLLEGTRNTTQARACCMRVEAVARLLDDLGWFAPPQPTHEIDITKHAWPAIRALQIFIAKQEELIRHEAALNDPEAAGTAMGRRQDARIALEQIEAACARAGIDVRKPAP
jgi:hypothetical protein